MSNSTIETVAKPTAQRATGPSRSGAIGMGLVLLVGLGAPFIGAGTLAWPAGWLYVVLTLVGSLAGRAVMLRAHPELAAERAAATSNPGTKSWDRVLVPLVLVGPAVVTLVAGLNHRFAWPPALSPLLGAIGVAIVLAAFVFASWAMASNPFFSSVVRIQAERGHRAISHGPYRLVRHPAYAATIPAQFGFALMLGSTWALVPAALVVAVIVLRTSLEDRALRAELPGYPEYSAAVRYRLLPGVW